MGYKELYAEKKRSPQDAVAMIEDNKKVQMCGEPVALLKALNEQKDRFSDLYLYSMLGVMRREAIEMMYDPGFAGHISLGIGFFSRWELGAREQGLSVDHMINHFSQFEDMSQYTIKPDYLLVNVAPMDEDGYFSIGTYPNGRSAVDAGAKVIIQVNEYMPSIYTDYHKIHIDEVDVLCEFDDPIHEFRSFPPRELDQQIAAHIIERIPNGATIQLGIGGVPGAIAMSLKDHKDLGIHTENFANTMTMLMKSGVVNNSKKTFCPGVAVTGIVQGDRETYDFVSQNKDVVIQKLAWVNDPNNIAQNKDMVSINSCMSVDLRGQVCSESLGMNVTGGSGGQLDFVRGARRAPGGQSFLVLPSTVEKKSGEILSRIALALDQGSVVTCPRNDVQYIVTEYGVAELADRNIREKALNLIAIAHPDFREQLLFDAKKYGYV